MSEKRFPPSIQRLRKAHKDGKVVKSQLLTMLSGWLFCGGFFCVTLPWVRSGTLIHWLKSQVLDSESALTAALLLSAALVVSLSGAVALGCAIAGSLQTGGLFATRQMVPDIKRLEPTRYLSKVKEGATEALFGLVRVAVLLTVLAPVVVAFVFNARSLVWESEETITNVVLRLVAVMIERGVAIVGLCGLLAYWFARWRHMKQHRMSMDELREEHKESEGDPHLRAARRHEHQALAMAEIERRVKSSKVLVVRRRRSN